MTRRSLVATAIAPLAAPLLALAHGSTKPPVAYVFIPWRSVVLKHGVAWVTVANGRGLVCTDTYLQDVGHMGALHESGIPHIDEVPAEVDVPAWLEQQDKYLAELRDWDARAYG